jgi:PPM family protein phosphatase
MKVAQGFGDTNTGRKRRRNEDAFVCEPPLFAVADGMGGAQAGEVASSLAAAALTEHDEDAAGLASGGEAAERRVIELIQRANRRVHQRALDDAAASGMGTTMTVALFSPTGCVTIGHVGDSRAYLLRDGELEQLTEDHSLVAELVRRGELSPEEAETHPQRSVITRALGTDPDVDVDTFSIQAQAEDVFLLCSDGLTTMVDGGSLAELVERNRGDLRAAIRALIKAANDRGGEDNITAVLFEVAEGGEDDATVERAAAVPFDEEDTLHPEDSVPVVQVGDGRSSGDTAVISVEELRSAMAAGAPAATAPAPPEEPSAPVGRRILAALVILALAALVVLLVVWGLAR